MNHRDSISRPPARSLLLVRHGATVPNLAGLRCGGDLDVTLTDLGRRQAEQAALHLRSLGTPVDVIVASHLQRTRETAQIIASMLPRAEVRIEPAFAERLLGDWNLRPLADNEAALAAGMTPPNGEPNAEFAERIGAAMSALLATRPRAPLLVASKGVARVLRELLELPSQASLGNGELVALDLPAFKQFDTTYCDA